MHLRSFRICRKRTLFDLKTRLGTKQGCPCVLPSRQGSIRQIRMETSMSAARRVAPYLFLVFSLMYASGISAGGSFDLPMEDKTQKAQVVLVGTVVRIEPSTKPGAKPNTAEIEVEAVFKNESSQTLKAKERIHFVFDWSAENTIPWCCKKAGRYLIFLQELKGAPRYFASANGSFGIYRLCDRNRCAK